MKLFPGTGTWIAGHRRPAVIAPLALGGAAAILLAGCAIVPAPGRGTAARPAGHAYRGASPRARDARLASGPVPSSSRKQLAEAGARAILASFEVPPGASRLPGAPAAGGGVLGRAPEVPATPDVVDLVSWWQSPGQPQRVLAWEEAHLSHRFSLSGSATSDGPPGTEPTWADMFSLPVTDSVLDSRQLSVQVVSADGGTAIRVDAQVTWTPARPAGERVPVGARAVTITDVPGMNRRGKRPPGPVTVTAAVRVGKLAALINGLPLARPGVTSCPVAFGDALILTFRARRGGPPLAVATVRLSGCLGVGFTIGGRNQPGLASTGGLAPRILKIAGLPWKIGR